MPTLLTPTEAACLLERPTRGRKVHTSSIVRWGKQFRFTLVWCNGWKVDRDQFLGWARREHRLPGSGEEVRRAMKHTKVRRSIGDLFLCQSLGIRT